MKIQYFLFSTILLISPSCLNKPSEYKQTQTQLPDLWLEETTLSNRVDSSTLSILPRLSQQEYDDLQISSIEDLTGYDSQDLSMGKILIDSEDGKVISVHIATEGELTEYLLSYDKDGMIKSKLLVAYEDLVENYCQISSTIKSGTITIQTINYTYSESDSLENDIADTITTYYHISPEFEFVSN